MKSVTAAALAACLMIGSTTTAVCADPQAAVPFERIELREPARGSHWRAYLTMAAGAALVGASFPLATRADHRYADYLNATDPNRIDDLFNETVRADRLASGALIAGEFTIAAGIWMRFLRPRAPAAKHVQLELSPSSCALAYRF